MKTCEGVRREGGVRWVGLYVCLSVSVCVYVCACICVCVFQAAVARPTRPTR